MLSSARADKSLLAVSGGAKNLWLRVLILNSVKNLDERVYKYIRINLYRDISTIKRKTKNSSLFC